MDRYDLRSELVRALKARGKKLNERANPIPFQCVRHDDRNPSAWLGDNAWGCRTCGFTETLYTLADALGVERPKRGFTVEDYAERKGFTLANLSRWGVRTQVGKYGDELVAIPYHDAQGNVLREKLRTAGKSFWGPGGGPLPLYGLDHLAKASPTDPVLIVEGESDCHACWSHSILAVGVPGASTWREEYAALLSGRPVFVWREPGESGANLVRAIANDLPDAKVIVGGDLKDPADLRLSVGPKQFKAALAARMATATPIGHEPPAVPFVALLGPEFDTILADKQKPIDAVPTPLPTWNAACRDDGGGIGLARGWHITAGANTGHGKSLLALNLGAAAIRHGERVAFVSLEMSKKQLTTRFLAIATGASVRDLEQGPSFDADKWKRMSRELDALYERTGGVLYVNDARLSKLSDIVDAIRYLAEVNGCRYVIVDYLQLARTAGRSSDLYAITEEVSHTVRDTAADLGLVSIGLSQFNRQTSANYDDPPNPQGLMGGSPLENDSDQVVLLDHSTYTRERLDSAAHTRLLLAKNRHGPLEQINVRWAYRNLTIAEVATRAPEPPTLDRGPQLVRTDRGEAYEAEDGDTSFPPPLEAA